jgi:predicted glycosyltransferase
VRVLCHAQNLSGVGHFVRMHAIAASLAERHEVYLVEGSRPFSRPTLDAEPTRIALPILRRDAHGGLIGADGEAAAAVLTRRAECLAAATDEIQPNVVLVDHYPFSKWELSEEIERAGAAARRANGDAQLVCSLRDIVPRTRYEAASGDRYDDEVLQRLVPFDAVLVHTDPRLTTLAAHFPAADRVTAPTRYTGVVVEPIADGVGLPHGQWAVASAGGLDAAEFLLAVAGAFGALASSGVAAMPLHVFASAHATPADLTTLQAAALEDVVVVHEFSSDFGAWLDGAALSISRGGYNTVAALLRSRVPAVVIPDPSVSDQRPRAAGLARTGVVVVDDGSIVPSSAALQLAFVRALERGRPDVVFDLDGAACTRDLLERLVAGEQPWAPERTG